MVNAQRRYLMRCIQKVTESGPSSIARFLRWLRADPLLVKWSYSMPWTRSRSMCHIIVNIAHKRCDSPFLHCGLDICGDYFLHAFALHCPICHSPLPPVSATVDWRMISDLGRNIHPPWAEYLVYHRSEIKSLHSKRRNAYVNIIIKMHPILYLYDWLRKDPKGSLEISFLQHVYMYVCDYLNPPRPNVA